MELFPAQPDLSLQISLPNSKQTSSWRRNTDDQEELDDLGFWKRALESKTEANHTFDPSLSNLRASSSSSSNLYNLIPNPFQNTNNSNNNSFQPFHQNQNNYQSLSEELGFLKPIRGIPVYHQNPNPPIALFSQPKPPFDASASSSTTAFHPHTLMRSKFLPRFPSKRSVRAPRMRWTTTLHNRFVHAVELLGGHESNFFITLLSYMFVLTMSLSESRLATLILTKTTV